MVCVLSYMSPPAVGVLYTALMEKVFKDVIPESCKKKLTHLQLSDMEKMESLRKEKWTSGANREPGTPGANKEPEVKALFNLSRHYGTEELAGMSWTRYHNSALLLHRIKRACKSGSVVDWIHLSCMYKLQ